jgi:hypothetical protein
MLNVPGVACRGKQALYSSLLGSLPMSAEGFCIFCKGGEKVWPAVKKKKQ